MKNFVDISFMLVPRSFKWERAGSEGFILGPPRPLPHKSVEWGSDFWLLMHACHIRHTVNSSIPERLAPLRGKRVEP